MARPKKQSADGGLTRARRDFTRAKARREQLKVAELEGKLVPIEVALAMENMRATGFRQAVMQLPGTWAARIVELRTAQDGQNVLRKMVDELLTHLQGMGARIRDRLTRQQTITASHGDRPAGRRASTSRHGGRSSRGADNRGNNK